MSRKQPITRKVTRLRRAVRLALKIAHREQQRLAFQPHLQENSTDWAAVIKSMNAALAGKEGK